MNGEILLSVSAALGR